MTTATRLPRQTEAAFLAQVLQYARLMGWYCFHPWLSVRSAPGFPDVLAVRGPRLVAAELKRVGGRATPAQREWLALLGQVPGVEARLWTPADWPEIEQTFARQEPR